MLRQYVLLQWNSRVIKNCLIIGDVYDFMIFSEIFNLIQECAEEKHKIIDVPFYYALDHFFGFCFRELIMYVKSFIP